LNVARKLAACGAEGPGSYPGGREATTMGSAAPAVPRAGSSFKVMFLDEAGCRRREPLSACPGGYECLSAALRQAFRTAAAVELKYSGGSMKPHSLNVEPLVRARR